MRAHEQTVVWEIPLSAHGTSAAKGWCQWLWNWWMARLANHRRTQLAALGTSWEAKREALKPRRVEAALDIAAAQGALSTATQMCGLTL